MANCPNNCYLTTVTDSISSESRASFMKLRFCTVHLISYQRTYCVLMEEAEYTNIHVVS